MKTRFLSLLLTILPFLTFAQETSEKALTIDQKIDAFFRPIADAVGSVIFYSVSFGDKSVPVVLIVLISL